MIGIFDSGVGGLSVWKEVEQLIPYEKFAYIADSGYCPYGPKLKSEIINRADKITKYLISQGATIIVVACNTATAAAIEYLRNNYNLPFIGMEPAIKPAIINSKTNVIGVLATKGTFNGELYHKTLDKYSEHTVVLEQIGTGLVEIVEQGKINSIEAKALLKKYLLPMIKNGADHIVLGCTHYPFLEKLIKDIVGEDINIVNPAPAVAKRVKNIMEQQNLICNKKEIEKNSFFITTGENLDLLKQMVKDLTPDKYSHYSFSKVEI